MTYRYVEPADDGVTPVVIELTEEQILDRYFDWWSNKLKEMGREHLISKQNCIDDFVVVHWAEPVL